MHTQKGFTLLLSIVITSMLLLVSFVVANISLKQLVLAYAGQESQHSFYNADSGLECAMYWDSLFDSFATTSQPLQTIICAGQSISSGSQNNIETFPMSTSLIGNTQIPTDTPTSIFRINYARGCAIVTVNKSYSVASPGFPSVPKTLIQSKGYNTCDINSDRRFERGIKIDF